MEIFRNLHIFTREVMRGGAWRFKKKLSNEIVYSIKCCNETATPFAWNNTGEPPTV